MVQVVLQRVLGLAVLLLLLGCGQPLAERADEVVASLAGRQFEKLASYVHPEKGLRFSPSAYVDLENDRVLSCQRLTTAMGDRGLYLWGHEEGSGAPLLLTFADYFARFVYDVNYAQAETVAVDKLLGQGATVSNLAKAYPESRFVEYHFSGFAPQFEGMDWKSLRLVFEQRGAAWFLVGIVHAQWSG